MGFKDEIPTIDQVYGILSRYSAEEYCKYANTILNIFNKKNKNSYNTYIVDATPSACDFNIDKKFIKKEHLDKLKLKWSYSTTKGSFIGFKVTVVLNQKTMSPISILIHSGAPNDAKIFDEVLKELRRRRLIKPKDTILFDKGYYSIKNYLIGINKYKIIPVIFPRKSFTIDKLKAHFALPLESYNKNKDNSDIISTIHHLTSSLINKLENWKKLKPERGIIEDFFKAAKDAFGLGEFHSYTVKSMCKNIYLCLILTTLVVQEGFKTKTALQRLAEGDVVQDTPVKNKKRKNKDDKENNQDKNKKDEKIGQQELNIETEIKYKTLDDFAEI